MIKVTTALTLETYQSIIKKNLINFKNCLIFYSSIILLFPYLFTLILLSAS